MILMSLDDVRPGMVLGVGLRNKEGHVLLAPGVSLTPAYILRLRQLGYCAIWIDDHDTRDIVPEDTLSEVTRASAMSVVRDTFTVTSVEAESLRSVSVTEIRKALESRRFQQVFQPVVDRVLSQVDTIVSEVLDRHVLTGLTSLRTHSTQLFNHCLDVTVTATMIARLMGYDRETLRKLAAGCILHDIGNIFLDSAMLDTAGRLDRDEFGLIKEHTVIGYLFMRDSLRLGVLASHVAYQHHERQDGTGYPRGLSGTNRIVQGPEMHFPGRINPLGEIAAIADLHDYLAADRTGTGQKAPDEVWQALHGAAGDQLNRAIVDLFLTVLPPYPLGSQIVMTSGRYKDHAGVVSRFDREALDRPVVRLLTDPAGNRISPVELDLRKDDARLRGVVGSSAPAPATAAALAE